MTVIARLFAALVLALSLGTTLAAPPAAAQGRDYVPLERLDRDVSQAIQRALRSAGIDSGRGITVMVSKNDCPSNCNDRVRGGMCYCDVGNCESNEEVTTGTGERQCRVRPTTASFRGPESGARSVTLR